MNADFLPCFLQTRCSSESLGIIRQWETVEASRQPTPVWRPPITVLEGQKAGQICLNCVAEPRVTPGGSLGDLDSSRLLSLKQAEKYTTRP